MLRMKASAVISKLEHVAVLRPGGGEDVAVEADVVGLGRREGGEVVVAGQRSGAGFQRLAVDPVRPPEGPALLERARRRAGQEAVAIAARAGVAAGVEAVGDDLARRSPRGRPGPTPLRLRRQVAGRLGDGRRSWPPGRRAWTPVSVRPATVSATGSRSTVSSAVSSSPCTVRRPGCLAQPRKPEPSYSMSSRTVGTGRKYLGHLESGRCAILLTNDDGIAAPGLQALRRALRELDGVTIDVIAPTPTAAPPPAASPPARRWPSTRSSSGTATRATRPTAPRSTASASPSSG